MPLSESVVSLPIESESDILPELYLLVIENALSIRDRQIFDLRFGLSTGKSMSLQHVASVIGVSGERIRQILVRCFRNIKYKIRIQRKKGLLDQPCARLAILLESVIISGADGNSLRLAEFIDSNLTYLPIKLAVQLTAGLLFEKSQYQKYEKEVQSIFLEKRRQKYLNFVQTREEERLSSLFSYIMWPGKMKPLEDGCNLPMQRTREVLEDGDGTNGVFISQKMKREIQYESELEMSFLMRLEASNKVIFYQEQPLALNYEDKSGKQRQYFPDIFFVLHDRRGVYVEIKPVFMMATQQNLMKWRALWLHCREKGYGMLVTDGNWTYQQIYEYPVSPIIQNEILTNLRQKPLDWPTYKQLKEKLNISRYEFLALILQQKLIWSLLPFSLTLPNHKK